MATLPIRVGWFSNPRGSNRAYPNDLRTWSQRNSILLGTTALTQPLQFRERIQTDLPRSGRAYPNALRTFTQNVDIWLIGKDALLPQRNRYDTSLPTGRLYPASLRTWTQNLQQTTLAPQAVAAAGPLPASDWQVPSSIGPANNLRTWTQNFNPSLIGQDALLPQRNRYDTSLPIARPYPNSLRTWTQNLQETTLAPRVLVLNGDVGSYSVTGQAAGLLYGHVLSGAIGSYSVTGSAAQFVVVTPFSVGAYSITGQAAALLEGYVLSGAVGSYSVTGLDVAILAGAVPTLATRSASFANQLGSRGAYPNDLRTWTRRNIALLGAAAVTPQQVRERIQTDLSGRQKAYPNDLRTWSQRNTVLLSTTASPQQIRERIQTDLPGRQTAYPNSLRTWTQNLQQTTLAPRVLVLGGDVGTYSVTGSVAQFTTAEPFGVGAYSITGQAAGLFEGYVLSGAVGSYSVTGSAAQFVVTEPEAVGSYSVTGSAAQFVLDHVLSGAIGNYNITGLASNLIFSGAVVVPPVVVQPGGGGVWGAVGGTSRQPRIRRRLKVATEAGVYSLSGLPAQAILRRCYRLRVVPDKLQIYGQSVSLHKHYLSQYTENIVIKYEGCEADASYNMKFSNVLQLRMKEERKRLIENDNNFLLAA